jgi:hypothetical protein
MSQKQTSKTKRIDVRISPSLKKEAIDSLMEMLPSDMKPARKKREAETIFESAVPNLKEGVASIVASFAEKYILRNIDELNLSPKNYNMYKDAFTVRQNKFSVTIEFSTSDWLISAMEEGCNSFSIKESMLNAKSKVSEEGHRYRTIMVENSAPSPTGSGRMPTEGSQTATTIADTVIQTIKNEIEKANDKYEIETKVEPYRVYTDKGYKQFVRVRETARLKETSNESKGHISRFDRIETYTSKVAYAKGKSPIGTSFSSFKTMTDKPGSASWDHPGFPGNKIFDNVLKTCQSMMEELIRDYMDF